MDFRSGVPRPGGSDGGGAAIAGGGAVEGYADDEKPVPGDPGVEGRPASRRTATRGDAKRESAQEGAAAHIRAEG